VYHSLYWKSYANANVGLAPQIVQVLESIAFGRSCHTILHLCSGKAGTLLGQVCVQEKDTREPD
jgi:hypothetical protein